MGPDDGPIAEGSQRELPPLPLRLLGQGLSLAIARAPWLWPLLRRPTRRFWERSAAHWDERIRPDREEHLAPLAAACDRIESEPQTILELGTGTGAGALMLARRFRAAQVRGADISAAMVDTARAKVPAELAHRIEFGVADASSLPYDDRAFDLVAQLNVPIYMDEVARVLRPGGHLIVASSLGPDTPYYTPDAVLARGAARRGLEQVGTGSASRGTYFLARRNGAAGDTQGAAATEGVREHHDKSAPDYNRQLRFFERILFGDGAL
jgi:SAM-dependent methyltransferase